MTIGFDKPLYVLPFDHRATFYTKMFGWKGTPTPEQTAQVAAAKQVIYDAFQAAVAGGVGPAADGTPSGYWGGFPVTGLSKWNGATANLG